MIDIAKRPEPEPEPNLPCFHGGVELGGDPDYLDECSWYVVCPACRQQDPDGDASNFYAHFEKVSINQGGNILHVLPGNETQAVEGAAAGRGSQIRIQYRCEWGHRFVQDISFHKGQVFAYAKHVGMTAESTDPPEFWRD